jgi:dihydrofolate synthase / folylpolyglutamate synthase
MERYRRLLERMAARRRFGMRPGLEGMQSLLARLGNPEASLRVIHVGGTNGKGSTSAMIASVLRESGARVGLFTSPHLLRFTERIRYDGREIDRADAAELGERVLAAADDHTFFELATAMALLHFAERRAEVVVLEVGLGGRLDATNVFPQPLATVVTSIGMDHADVLGDSLTAIAREKAGIFKAGAPAIFAADDAGARAVLLETAERVGAPAQLFGRDFDARDLPSLGLLGAHQSRNAALARQALLALPAELRPTRRALEDGLARVEWPGRLEWLAPDVLVDAAHNEEGARALAASLPSLVQARPITLVVGVVADKDARAILQPLLPLATRVIATTPPSPRALPAHELAAIVSSLAGEHSAAANARAIDGAAASARAIDAAAANARAIDSPAEALAAARAEDGVTVVAGSIFLVGEARRIVLAEPADELAVQDALKPQKL